MRSLGESDATLVFAIRGDHGVSALEIQTGWFLPNALSAIEALDVTELPQAIVGFHSPLPMSGGDIEAVESCPVMGGDPVEVMRLVSPGRYLLRLLLLDGPAGVWTNCRPYTGQHLS
jgi:hypothetical protein